MRFSETPPYSEACLISLLSLSLSLPPPPPPLALSSYHPQPPPLFHLLLLPPPRTDCRILKDAALKTAGLKTAERAGERVRTARPLNLFFFIFLLVFFFFFYYCLFFLQRQFRRRGNVLSPPVLNRYLSTYISPFVACNLDFHA